MANLETFLFENDLKKAIKNEDQKHIFLAMRELTRAGQTIPMELQQKLCKYLDPEGKSKKSGPKGKWLNYNCDNDSTALNWLKVVWDYKYLCKNENIARFVVNSKDSFDLPIFLNDASIWNLTKYERRDFPSQGEIKFKLCDLYKIAERTFDNYHKDETLINGINDLFRTVEEPLEYVRLDDNQFTQFMGKRIKNKDLARIADGLPRLDYPDNDQFSEIILEWKEEMRKKRQT